MYKKTFHQEFHEQYDRFMSQTGIAPNIILASSEAIKEFDELARNQCMVVADDSIAEPQRVYNGLQIIRATVPGIIVARIQE